MQLPYHEIPRTTPPNRCRLCAPWSASSSGPKRSEFSSAMGRAPMAKYVPHNAAYARRRALDTAQWR